MRKTASRSRVAVLGLTATTTALLGLATLSPPAALSAPPAEDCKTAFPVADLVAGAPVTGLTVSNGTVPEGFSGEVLGVLDDGIAFDVDMVMVRLTSPEIDRVGGIWSGMSGSPVYAADGRLIGAVAYGLAWGPSPVAGVTPFETMDEHLPAAAPAKVALPTRLARRIAAETDVTVRQAEQGIAQLKMPMTVSGVPQKRLAKTRNRAYLDASARAGAGMAATSGPADLVAGGNLAMTWAYGDVTGGGVGTVTSVCHGSLVGFGHPADFMGDDTTYTMHSASAIYVQDDPASAPFKVANFGPGAGTITGDNLTGVSGPLGTLPDTAQVESTVSFAGRSRTGTTHVSLQEGMAAATYYQLVGNMQRVLDGNIGGTADVAYTIAGTRPDGTTFSVDVSDKVTGASLIDRVVWNPPDTVFAIKNFPGVDVDTVTHTAAVTRNLTTSAISGLKYRRAGTWVSVKDGGRIVATAGSTLKLRVQVTDSSGSVTNQSASVSIPARLSGQDGQLQVQGGNSGEEWIYNDGTGSLDDFLESLTAGPRNDQIAVDVSIGRRKTGLRKQVVSAPRAHVVGGMAFYQVLVK